MRMVDEIGQYLSKLVKVSQIPYRAFKKPMTEWEMASEGVREFNLQS